MLPLTIRAAFAAFSGRRISIRSSDDNAVKRSAWGIPCHDQWLLLLVEPNWRRKWFATSLATMKTAAVRHQ